MPASGRTRLSLLQLLLLVLCAPASSSDDLWSACDTENYLYDYKILDKGCMLHCLYLTSSYKEPEYNYLDTLQEIHHSLEGTATCSASGSLCVTIVSAKFFDHLIPSRYPTIKFVLTVGSTSVPSGDHARQPVSPDGRVRYNSRHCFSDVNTNTLIQLYAMGTGLSVAGGKVSLISESDGLTARRVMHEGKNGTLFSIGDIYDTIVDLKITFTR